MRILVFGAAGFIGSNLVRNLSSHGKHEILGFDNFSMGNMLGNETSINLHEADMCDSNEVRHVLENFQPDRIYHLVANSDIAKSNLNPRIDVDNTFRTTVSLVQALNVHPVKEVVFSSSSAIYGEQDAEILENTVTKPASPYGWMKLASEELLKYSQACGNIERVFVARFPNVTGPFQTHGVVFDLVNKLRDTPDLLKVLGDGSQFKPYGHVTDLVDVIDRVMGESWNGYLDLNLGPNDRVAVHVIAEEICRISGLNPKIEYGSERQGWRGDVPEYRFSTAKAENLVGNLGFRTSLDAVRDSVAWQWQRVNSQ